MLTVPRTSTALATVLIETFFYGIYLVLFVTSIYLLFTVQSRGLRRERTVWLSPILTGGSVLFVAVTGHWIFSIDRLFLAFVIFNDGANPVAFYRDYSQATQILQSSLLLVSLAIVDGLVVHRLYTVYSHNHKVVILPGLAMLGLVGDAIGGICSFAQFKVGDSVDDLANGWIIAESAFTVVATMYCTALISWTLWRVQSILEPSGGRNLMSGLEVRPLIQIVLQVPSLLIALRSSTWTVFFITAYAMRSNLRFLLDVTPAVVGTANALIYVRVGLGWTQQNRVPAPVTPIRLNVGKDEYGEVVERKEVGLV
ncbi:hypothetical protein C8R46DRAFT_1253119 [Mycena filopes]|nr:hypothetical protein C8R46DRAFT_1253119 [Mycena filopes]